MASMAVRGSETTTMQPARVLVVDDSRLVRVVVKSCLRSTGYTVDEAEDGMAALQLCDARPYDVVVSDLNMPGLDGFGLVKALGTRSNRPEVILLSGASTLAEDAAERGLNLALHECLSKPPAAPETVIRAVERALMKKRARDLGLQAAAA